MNTNRSDKLGSSKALKLFGSRRGLAPYNAVQQVRAYQVLSDATIGQSGLLQKAFNRMAGAVSTAAVDFHQFARFINHGPTQSADLRSQLTIALVCGDNPWYDKDEAETPEADTGDPGISVHELVTMAQRYAYLHPAAPGGPGGAGRIRQ